MKVLEPKGQYCLFCPSETLYKRQVFFCDQIVNKLGKAVALRPPSQESLILHLVLRLLIPDKRFFIESDKSVCTYQAWETTSERACYDTGIRLQHTSCFTHTYNSVSPLFYLCHQSITLHFKNKSSNLSHFFPTLATKIKFMWVL